MSLFDTTNPLAFQYGLRAGMLDELKPDERRIASEQRDRELEDYLGYLEQRITTEGETIPRTASGRAVTNSVAPNVTGTVAVTFPAGRFTVAPNVVATIEMGNPDNFLKPPGVSAITTTGCTIAVQRSVGTGTIPVHWIAVQP